MFIQVRYLHHILVFLMISSEVGFIKDRLNILICVNKTKRSF